MANITLQEPKRGYWDRLYSEKKSLTLETLRETPSLLDQNIVAIGVEVPTDLDPVSIKAWLPRLRLIDIKVDSFGDGRVFTLARDLLALGFAGEIRVSGPVMPDQTAFFERVGVHVLSLPSGDRSESFNRLKLKNRFFYQTSSDKAVPVQQQRHKRDERAAQ